MHAGRPWRAASWLGFALATAAWVAPVGAGVFFQVPDDAGILDVVKFEDPEAFGDGFYLGPVYFRTGPAQDPANSGMRAWFNTPDRHLPSSAALWGGTHFQWFQVVTGFDGVGVDLIGDPLVTPFIDPPAGGFGNDPATAGDDSQWHDSLPWYWDEQPRPPGKPDIGFDLMSHVTPYNDLTNPLLEFIDFPHRPLANEAHLTFETYLVCVDDNGGMRQLLSGFKWRWDKNANTTANQVEFTARMHSEHLDIGGTRFELPPDYTQWTFYADGNGQGGFFTAPDGDEAGHLITGSPTTMQKTIDTPDSLFSISFEYLFETTTGTLEVLLDGQVVKTIVAPGVLGNKFQLDSVMVMDPLLLGLDDAPLAFRLDGPSGSKIWIDATYLTSFSVEPVPEPSSAVLLFVAMIAPAMRRRRR